MLLLIFCSFRPILKTIIPNRNIFIFPILLLKLLNDKYDFCIHIKNYFIGAELLRELCIICIYRDLIVVLSRTIGLFLSRIGLTYDKRRSAS